MFFYILSHLFGVPSCGQTRDGSRTCWCYRRRYRYRKRRNVYWLILLFRRVYCYSGSWTLGPTKISCGLQLSICELWLLQPHPDPSLSRSVIKDGTFTISWPSLRDQGMIIWHSGRRMHIAADVYKDILLIYWVYFPVGRATVGMIYNMSTYHSLPTWFWCWLWAQRIDVEGLLTPQWSTCKLQAATVFSRNCFHEAFLVLSPALSQGGIQP